MITRATYQFGSEAIELSAESFQDSGDGFSSELLVLWTDETRATLAAAGLFGAELDGCVEAIESAWWAAEREQCRLSKVRQQRDEAAA